MHYLVSRIILLALLALFFLGMYRFDFKSINATTNELDRRYAQSKLHINPTSTTHAIPITEPKLNLRIRKSMLYI